LDLRHGKAAFPPVAFVRDLDILNVGTAPGPGCHKRGMGAPVARWDIVVGGTMDSEDRHRSKVGSVQVVVVRRERSQEESHEGWVGVVVGHQLVERYVILDLEVSCKRDKTNDTVWVPCSRMPCTLAAVRVTGKERVR
jgi:hypothetical protein